MKAEKREKRQPLTDHHRQLILSAGQAAGLRLTERQSMLMEVSFETEHGDIQVYWKPRASVFVILGLANAQDDRAFGWRDPTTRASESTLESKLKAMAEAIKRRTESMTGEGE